MDDSSVKALCDFLCDARRIDHFVHKLTGRAGIRVDVIILCKALVADVMIDAERVLRYVKKRSSIAKPP